MRRLRSLVRQHLARRLGVPEIPLALRRLGAAGFDPRLVVDVGAYRGEFAAACLESWPACSVICFEAQKSAVQLLEDLRRKHAGLRVIPTLVGAADRSDVVLHTAETASSVLVENTPNSFATERHAMVALDNVNEIGASDGVDLLKIDVQGYELEVLRGAEKILTKTRVLLVELNLIDIHHGAPLMPEVIAWLYERRFVPFDICGLTRRPLDQALWQADLLFVPRDSPLRTDKRWGES